MAAYGTGNSWQILEKLLLSQLKIKSLFNFFTQPLLKYNFSWFQFPFEGLLEVCSEGVDIGGNLLDTRREGGKKETESE